MNNNYTKWSEEEIDNLKKYSNKMSFREMAKLYFPKRTPTSLQKKSLKLGLSSSFKSTINQVNKNFYDIPNLLNCYYAGNFAADGYLQFRGNSTTYALQINTKDIEIIENFKRDCGFTGNIRCYQRKNYKKETFKDVSYMYITNVNEWREPLKNNFGIIPQKTFRLSPPNLQHEQLKFAYLIGYLDGDGSILKDKYMNRITIRYYSSNINILEWILNELNDILKKYNYTIDVNIGKVNNCYSIFIGGKAAAIIFNYLKNINVPKLKRKWENPIILKRLEEYKLKYPNLFIEKPV